MAKTSIIEQALLQVSQLEEATKQNAKGILASTMKQELKDLLKESIKDEDEEMIPENVDEINGVDETHKIKTDSIGEDTESEDEDEESEDEITPDDTESEDNEMDSDDTTELPFNDGDGDEEMGSPFNDGDGDEDDVLDLTKNDNTDDVVKIFKSLSPEDSVIIKKDDDTIQFSDGNGGDYIIKLNENEDGDDDETIYEIELPGDDTHAEDIDEASRTKSNVHGDKNDQDRSGLKSKKKYKAGSDIDALNEEIKKLKKQNAEYKSALTLFKEKLNEVAIFNANLAYSNKLFTEHSTTKQEKLNVLERFDKAKSLSESKLLYNTIKDELSNKKQVTETVAQKLTTTISTSVSKETLSESKSFENPEFSRIRELMNKINKK